MNTAKFTFPDIDNGVAAPQMSDITGDPQQILALLGHEKYMRLYHFLVECQEKGIIEILYTLLVDRQLCVSNYSSSELVSSLLLQHEGRCEVYKMFRRILSTPEPIPHIDESDDVSFNN